MFVQLRRQQGLASSECVDGTTVSFLFQLWMRILLTHWTVQIAHSERRCYCNDVSCVTTGYMCKSSVGVCFSQTTHDGASRFRFYHACVEMLPEHHANACAGGMQVGSRVTARSEVRLDDRVQIVCCETDMCNYNRDARSQGEGQLRPPSANLNNQQTEEGGHSVHHPSGDQQRASASAADRHVWFQALVIAVSLIGTVVLLFLLLVTVKILILNQRRRRHPPASRSRSSKANDVIEVTNLNLYPDEHVRCHVIGPKAEMDRSCCCCCEDEEMGGRKEGLKEEKSGRLTGCGRVGGDVAGGKVFPVSYQCVAFTAGENAFRTDLVPYHHHHHAYLLDHHHHHCRHFPHHCNHHALPRYPHLNPREKCRCLSNDIQSNEALPKNI